MTEEDLLPAVVDGHIQFGMYDQPFSKTNLIDAEIGWPRPLKWLRLKEWQAAQILTERFIICLSIVTIKTLAHSQIKIFDRKTNKYHLTERKLLPWQIQLSDQVLDSVQKTKTIRFHNQLKRRRITVDFEDKNLSGHIEGIDGILQVVSLPFPERRGLVSHKGHFDASGEIKIDGKRYLLKDAHLLMDDHKAYYSYVMKYNWTTGAGVDVQKRRVAWNLTQNEGLEQERFNENCLWLEHDIIRLPAIFFKHESDTVWKIYDHQGEVDLTFERVHDSRVLFNYGVIESRYQGPLGEISGKIGPVKLKRQPAMGERFWLRA